MAAIGTYESDINKALLAGRRSMEGLRIWGISDPERMEQRVPAFSFTLEGWSPRAVAEVLAGEWCALDWLTRIPGRKSIGWLRLWRG